MKKHIFISIHYLEIGGAEISLIGLLQALDYRKCDVDLFVYSHRGELMQFIPKEVNLLPEIPAYAQIERPMKDVLKDGYGQCNTKGTLFMALLRAVGIPCRVHGFTIDKRLQKGAMTGIVYWNAPRNIFHSWVEVLNDGKWYELEGFILDAQYLTKLQKLHSDCTGAFCGYGVAVADFQHPSINWNGNNTYIQSEGINQDFGIYSSPDELLKEHRQEMSAIKAFLYRNLGRHLMNRNVKSIRANEI